LAGMWGQALEVGRNVGASFRSWPECRGAGFKRGPESWRDKLSKLTIKQSFFASILQIQFFFEIFTPQKGGGQKHSPPLTFQTWSMCNRGWYTIIDFHMYVFVWIWFIYLVLDLFMRVIIPYLLLLYMYIILTIIILINSYLIYKSMERHKGQIYYQIKDRL
jgi:hypothetical protein